MISISLREPNHFAHLDYDFGERESTLLFGRYSRSYRKAERIYECEESFVVPGNELIRGPGNGN